MRDHYLCRDKVHGITDTLQAENRAAFEILTNDTGYGVWIPVPPVPSCCHYQ